MCTLLEPFLFASFRYHLVLEFCLQSVSNEVPHLAYHSLCGVQNLAHIRTCPQTLTSHLLWLRLMSAIFINVNCHHVWTPCNFHAITDIGYQIFWRPPENFQAQDHFLSAMSAEKSDTSLAWRTDGFGRVRFMYYPVTKRLFPVYNGQPDSFQTGIQGPDLRLCIQEANTSIEPQETPTWHPMEVIMCMTWSKVFKLTITRWSHSWTLFRAFYLKKNLELYK